ncbi:hypothetical protein F5B21DRAFT_133222 [Xylaria acuta]|nr:hypothetical protein F5B21DRAFT_133222 [Xylaria acuta]
MNPARPPLKGGIGLFLFAALGLLFCHQVVSYEVNTKHDDTRIIGMVSTLAAHEAWGPVARRVTGPISKDLGSVRLNNVAAHTFA